MLHAERERLRLCRSSVVRIGPARPVRPLGGGGGINTRAEARNINTRAAARSINHLAAARSINHLAAARSIWLISFTDLICLMLAFFVLVYSMSEPEQHRWQAMVQSLAARQVGGRGAVFNVALLDPRSPISLDYLGALLTLQFAGNPDLAGVVPVRQDDRVVIGLLDTQLFEEDQLTFSERGRQALFILGGVLGRISNRIEITGHAELELSAAPNERDSWELALSRSVAVGTALHQAGYQRRLVVRSVGVTVGRAHLIDVVIRDLDEGT